MNRHRRRPRHLLVATAVAGLVVAGCGGDDAPSAEEVEAIGVLIDAELSVDEQRCILDGLQGLGIGPERIVDRDLSPHQHAEEHGDSHYTLEDKSENEA